ncbi:MAG TPA: hypothetical protein EYN66_23195 [Myxococcales bacterium]|nr:hypothetical protein [Myxococcales bacterium]
MHFRGYLPQVGCINRLFVCVFLLLWSTGCTPPTSQLKKTQIKSDQATIVTFTDLRGTLKPCGCSPDLRKGGVDRIAHHVDGIRESTPDALVLHAGNLLLDDEGIPKERKEQVALRTKTLAASLKVIGIAAATLGEHDLAQGLDWLTEKLTDIDMPIVATNVEGPQWAAMSKPYFLLRSGPVRVGVIGLLPPGPQVTNALEAATRACAKLREMGADVIVALSSLGLRYGKKLMRKKVDIDLIVAAGQTLKSLVSSEIESIGQGQLIQSHVQGGHIGVTTVHLPKKPNTTPKFAYQLTSLDWKRPSHEGVKTLMTNYDKALKTINLKSAGTLPELKPGQASYVGVDACLECHEEVQRFWKRDKHSHAWETLVKDGKTFDLECVSCHTTGYGIAGGSILGALKNLTDVQCEVCHGPGSIHAEDGEAASISKTPKESLCVTCHNPKHSTRFKFKTYRKRLIVPGHGR